MDSTQLVFRLFLAAVLGAVIGFDRERHTWVAGLRTHMLVCLGACLAMLVSAFGFEDVWQHWPQVVLDPSRVAAQVISGIGFLGAGTIMFMHRENTIRGLTTAAGLWTVAAIGLAVGGGMYLAAISTTAIAWIVLAMLKPVEHRFAKARMLPQLRLRISGQSSLATLEQAVAGLNLPPWNATLERDEGSDEVSIRFQRSVDRAVLASALDALRTVHGVEFACMEQQSAS